MTDVLCEMLLGTVAGTLGTVALDAGSVTDPARWDANSWLSDVMPRLTCGLSPALAHDFLADV